MSFPDRGTRSRVRLEQRGAVEPAPAQQPRGVHAARAAAVDEDAAIDAHRQPLSRVKVESETVDKRRERRERGGRGAWASRGPPGW